jgi:hypothetical protein
MGVLRQIGEIEIEPKMAAWILAFVALGVLFLFAPLLPASKEGVADPKQDQATKEAEEIQQAIQEFQPSAEAAMRNVLRDPGSAQYSNVSAVKYRSVYVFCGFVNAKNGFGGYTGYERFIATLGLAATEDNDSDFAKIWNEACTGNGYRVDYF